MVAGDAEFCCKVSRVAGEYGLSSPSGFEGDFDAYLAARWTGEGYYEATGLRTLADWINRQVLRRVYQEHGREATQPRRDVEYEVLTDDAPPEDLNEVVADLENDGISVSDLRETFVSKSTLARHLNDHVGAQKVTRSRGSGREKVDYAEHQAAQIVADALKRFEREDTIANATEANLDVEFVLSCPVCPTRVKLETALEQGFVCEHVRGPGSVDHPRSRRPASDVDHPRSRRPASDVDHPRSRPPSSDTDQPHSRRPSSDADHPRSRRPASDAEEG